MREICAYPFSVIFSIVVTSSNNNKINSASFKYKFPPLTSKKPTNPLNPLPISPIFPPPPPPHGEPETCKPNIQYIYSVGLWAG